MCCACLFTAVAVAVAVGRTSGCTLGIEVGRSAGGKLTIYRSAYHQHSLAAYTDRYNIQLSCPSECIYCSAFWKVDLSNPYMTFIFAPYMLVLFGLVGVYIVLWIPCVWFKPNVAYDYERVREVPYQCGTCTTVGARRTQHATPHVAYSRQQRFCCTKG